MWKLSPYVCLPDNVLSGGNKAAFTASSNKPRPQRNKESPRSSLVHDAVSEAELQLYLLWLLAKLTSSPETTVLCIQHMQTLFKSDDVWVTGCFITLHFTDFTFLHGTIMWPHDEADVLFSIEDNICCVASQKQLCRHVISRLPLKDTVKLPVLSL